MSSLFGGGSSSSATQQVASQVASSPTITQLPKPRVTRMPTDSDPAALAAAQRSRRAALQRQGRLSTILTDQTQEMIGSGGRSLGA